MSDIIVHQLKFKPRTIKPIPGSFSNRYFLVLFHEEPSAEIRSQLSRLGCEPIELLSSLLFLCAASNQAAEEVRATKLVRWICPYDYRFKVAPDLRERQTGMKKLSPLRPLAKSDEKVSVRIQLHRGHEASKFRNLIAKAAHIAPAETEIDIDAVLLTLQRRFIADLANLEVVRWVAPQGPPVQCDIRSRTLMNADVSVNGTFYRGDGEKVCVNELGGFDVGSPSDVHPAFAGRVDAIYMRRFQNSSFMYAPASPADESHVADYDGHGTHVAGCALASGMTSAQEPVEGIAPAARLVFMRMLSVPANLRIVLEPPYVEQGARIHTNSWTEGGAGYAPIGDQIDHFVWDHPDMLVCVAAGNDSSDMGNNKGLSAENIYGPAQAKNALTVGASESDRARPRTEQANFQATYSRILSGFDDPPFRDNLIADNPEGVAAFSSRGPVEGSRLKPDIVAPGTSILSAGSRKAGPFPDLHGQSVDAGYYYLTGTSMAAPAVAGCAAVLRQFLADVGVSYVPASLLKAMLINGARPLKGQFSPSEASPIPNNVSGWGMVDLAGSVLMPGPENGMHVGGPIKEGEEERFTITVRGSTLKVTIAWTDLPGAYLQNDLDLIVIASDGTERHGNMGTDPGFDRTNNVEQVNWQAIPPGEQTVIVRAHRVMQFPQAYSVAWRVTHP